MTNRGINGQNNTLYRLEFDYSEPKRKSRLFLPYFQRFSSFLDNSAGQLLNFPFRISFKKSYCHLFLTTLIFQTVKASEQTGIAIITKIV